MSTDQPKKRSRLFVNNKIQGRALMQIAFYWATYHVVLWHAMFLYRYFEYRTELSQGGESIPFVELFGQFVHQHSSMMICAAAVFPFLLWDALKFTHRIAGPLVRFQTTLRAMTEGKTARRVKLRKGDLLVDLQDSFNEYLDTMNFSEEPTTTNDHIMQEEDASILSGVLKTSKVKKVASSI